jgi:hypothetical protein
MTEAGTSSRATGRHSFAADYEGRKAGFFGFETPVRDVRIAGSSPRLPGGSGASPP